MSSHCINRNTSTNLTAYMECDPICTISRASAKKKVVDFTEGGRMGRRRVYIGVQRKTSSIRVFKQTINLGHCKEDLRQENNNQSEYNGNFELAPH